jgi:TRAP-type mannitol/chloroaromatic compound transport system substrate-binding protein
MKMSKHIRIISLMITLLTLVMFTAGPAAAKTLRWKMTTSWPAGIPIYTDMAEVYAENVEKMSGGRIKIQVLPGGAIAPALEVTDSVRKGIAEMGHTWPGYDIGSLY